MSTQPIEHKGYSYTYAQPRKTHADADFPLGPEQSKNRHESAVESKAGIRDRIQTLLGEVPKKDGNKLSFQDIVNYKDSLEAEWDRVVAGDLTRLGVDMTVKFRLMHDPATGNVTANNDHPDKLKIDQYFASNPDMVDGFEKVLALGKLADVAARKLSPQDMTQTLDSEAMAWWYQSNMDTASLFTGGGVVFGMGSSAYKGLDIRV